MSKLEGWHEPHRKPALFLCPYIADILPSVSGFREAPGRPSRRRQH